MTIGQCAARLAAAGVRWFHCEQVAAQRNCDTSSLGPAFQLLRLSHRTDEGAARWKTSR